MADTRTEAQKAADAKLGAGSDKAEKPTDKPAEKPASHATYGRAGESGDPAVQKLLAEREAHVMNSQPDPSFAAQREAAEAAIKDIDKRLNELGFTAE